jgi:hypothetical protein
MALLERARQGFLAQGRLYEVALTSLDLVTVRAQAGQLESVLPLIQDIVEAFPADLGQAGVLRALGSVETALLEGEREALEDVLAATAGMIRRFRREPLLAFEGLPRGWGYGIDPNG